MNLILSNVTFRYSSYRKDFAYVGDLYMSEMGQAEIRNITRRGVPIEHAPPLAVYVENDHLLKFTIKGIHFLKAEQVDIKYDLPINDLQFV